MTQVPATRERAKVSVWNDPKRRALFFQYALAVLLALAFVEIARNTASNLAKLNQDLGFSFLTRSAGFDIAQTLIPYSSVSNYGRALLVGFLNTVLISVLAILAATVLGFFIGVMRLSKNWIVSRVAATYIEFFRNIPLLLQIFVWYSLFIVQLLPAPKQALTFSGYFFLSNRGLVVPEPSLASGEYGFLASLLLGVAMSTLLVVWARRRQIATGKAFPKVLGSLLIVTGCLAAAIALGSSPVSLTFPSKTAFSFSGGLTVIPELIALFLALSVYMATYIAEAVRAGIQSVGRGQSEAAFALGLKPLRTMRLVIVPQAMRVIVPPLATTYLGLIKNSSLAVAIGYPDLVATGGTVLNQTGKAIEIVSIWMVVYLSLSLLTSFLMNWYNATNKLVER